MCVSMVITTLHLIGWFVRSDCCFCLVSANVYLMELLLQTYTHPQQGTQI